MEPAASGLLAAQQYIHAALKEHLLYEAIGLFWLWAELIILFAVCEARHGVQHGEARPWKMRLFGWNFYFALFAFLILVRHYFIFSEPYQPEHSTAGWYIEKTWQHLAVWSAFVLGWVLLESAIVFQGARAYVHFAGLCRAALRPMVATLILFITLSVSAHMELAMQDDPMQALRDAEVELQVWRQGVYLYLRIAGIVWVAVEWVAAVLLWRGQGLLWAVARQERRA